MKRICLSLLLIAAATNVDAVQAADSARLDEVVERGVRVMPFDLEKTLHIFDKTETGGVQRVIAKDAGDAQQIGLIRGHLADIAAGFRQGNFSKQRRIHGEDMPGLTELAGANGAVLFAYRELPNGAEIEYSAEQPALVDAIHRYFNAQLSDHARHAIAGDHAMHHDHKP
jgi:hypothetical protein